jgi:CDP-4-dehydro-6-deoxyglucose reductase
MRPLAGRLPYLPGEFVLLEDADRMVPPRSYSIANPQRSDGLISVLVTRVAGGQTSGWVHDRLRPGDEVTVTGPYGTFVADPAAAAPCLHLAAGSGLAPIRALIESALEASPPRSLTLVFSAGTKADVLDRDRFLSWQGIHPHFRYIRTLTRGPGAEPRGRIPDVLPSLCPHLADHEVFIAGAPGFVRACALAAEALGAVPARMHTEPFFVELPVRTGPVSSPAGGAVRTMAARPAPTHARGISLEPGSRSPSRQRLHDR